MKLMAWLTAPFAQPTTDATPATTVPSDTPVMIALPAPLAGSDLVAMAETRLAQHHKDGADLVVSLRRMITSAPAIARRVVDAAHLGRESERQAAIVLREYARTGVALVPEAL